MNKSTVWIVYNDSRKNMSSAEKYGQLKDVFSSVGRNYDGSKMIDYARSILKNWKEGDSLLLVGDPTLCCICIAVALERTDMVPVLRWNRNDFAYERLELNFNYL